MKIQIITASETYPLRHEILRPNQTIEDCKYPLDMKQDTIHLGAFIDGKLISIASFFKENSTSFINPNQYRLRGMATLPKHRSMKAGSSLILKAEQIMSASHTELWWCNARTSVSDYYSKLGLKVEGGIFDIEPIGDHVLMYKELPN